MNLLPGPVAVIGPADAALICHALALTRQQLRRDGRPIPYRLDALEAACRALLAVPGRTDATPPTAPQTAHVQTLTADEAAKLLGVSARTVRRLAPALDGRKAAGVWSIPADAIREHLEGTTP